MIIDLSNDEAKLLTSHLIRHIQRVESELVHTDKVAMQHELAREVDALRAIERRIEEQLS
jgi:hypothetical protein